jgi:hypothetical protein
VNDGDHDNGVDEEDHGEGEECVKVDDVAFAYALACPDTVMIHLFDADIA